MEFLNVIQKLNFALSDGLKILHNPDRQVV